MTDPENPGYVDPTKECFAVFKELDIAGPIHMLNLLRFREQAAYDDGTVATGREAYRNYARESGPIFSRLGGKQVWLGTPELTLIGPNDEAWDLAFIAEYPSKESFVAMIRDPDYRKAVLHRQAAVLDSRLISMNPIEPGDHYMRPTNLQKEKQDMSKQPRPLKSSEIESLRQETRESSDLMRKKLNEL